MRRSLWLLILCLASTAVLAADETPVTIKVGGTIFGDFSYTENDARPSSFQITRAYINLTGTVTPLLSFRITPDIARENGSTGSQTFRLKYAYAQVNLDQWTTKGSWVRAGMQQTPYLDYVEQVYRYRFQGTGFSEREGFLASSDNGVSVRYAFPNDRGDLHAGYYNGEGYTKAETNDDKAIQVRASLRPVKGLRLTGFAVLDQAASDKPRERYITSAMFEHARGNAGLEYLLARDQFDARGWSAWATPRFGKGFEALLRYDSLRPDVDSDATKSRDIVGVAYWMRGPKGTTAAVLVDRDHATSTTQPDDTRYGVHVVLSF